MALSSACVDHCVKKHYNVSKCIQIKNYRYLKFVVDKGMPYFYIVY